MIDDKGESGSPPESDAEFKNEPEEMASGPKPDGPPLTEEGSSQSAPPGSSTGAGELAPAAATPDSDPVPKGSPEEESVEPGLIIGLGVTTAILFGLRYASEHVDSNKSLFKIYFGALILMIAIRFLRRSLWAACIAVTLIATVTFAYKNWDDIKAKRLSFKQAAVGVVELATGIGPGKELKTLLKNTKRRFIDKDTKAHRELISIQELLSRIKPGLDVSVYLSKINTKDKQINILGSRLAQSCANADHLCEATKILSFVTDRIAYRNDPTSTRAEGDYPKTPLHTLQAEAGDCEDKTILLISLLGTLGIRSYMVFEAEHAHALVCFDAQIEDLLSASIRDRGRWAINYVEDVVGPLRTEAAVVNLFSSMAPPCYDGRQFCYAAESTAPGSWLGLDQNRNHLAVYDPISNSPARCW